MESGRVFGLLEHFPPVIDLDLVWFLAEFTIAAARASPVMPHYRSAFPAGGSPRDSMVCHFAILRKRTRPT